MIGLWADRIEPSFWAETKRLECWRKKGLECFNGHASHLGFSEWACVFYWAGFFIGPGEWACEPYFSNPITFYIFNHCQLQQINIKIF